MSITSRVEIVNSSIIDAINQAIQHAERIETDVIFDWYGIDITVHGGSRTEQVLACHIDKLREGEDETN